jgi:molecular chaperone GrpE
MADFNGDDFEDVGVLSERDLEESAVEPDSERGPSGLARSAESGEVEDLARERDEMKAVAQRVQADFENYRKRVMREQTALAERASDALVEQLLPVLDNFELALLSLDDADEKVRKGVELVYADFLSVLERAGLQRIDTNGQPFDPEVHEAVAHEHGGLEEGYEQPTVVQTMREGYRLKGRVLRPAMVKVAG